MDKIRFEIWCIKQSIMRLEENYDMARDEDYKKHIRENIKEYEKKVEFLLKNLEEKNI